VEIARVQLRTPNFFTFPLDFFQVLGYSISTMKILWYHWLVYRLFFRVWNPIFKNNPQLTRYFVDHMEGYMQQNHDDIGSKWNEQLGQY
jgi:hypothetical protein